MLAVAPSMRVKILVTDDAEPVRLALVDALEWLRPSAHVQTAADLPTAVGMLESFRPDVVVFDMAMDDARAGLRLLDAAQRAPRPPPTILVSGLPASDERVISAIGAGVDAFVRKPVRVENLGRALEAVEAGRRHVDASTG